MRAFTGDIWYNAFMKIRVKLFCFEKILGYVIHMERNVFHRPSISIYGAIVLCWLPVLDVLGEDYDVPEESIVATPVGYERNVILPNGEIVKLYTDMLSYDALTNCRAVMFQILSPKQDRGKNFLCRHSGCSCYMCKLTTSMTNLYQVGKVYLFSGHDTVSNILSSAYDIRQPPLELKMERNWGSRLYCNIEEVDEQIKQVDDYSQKESGWIEECKEKMKQLPEQKSSRRELHDLKCQIMRMEFDLTNNVPELKRKLLQRKELLLHKRF